MNCENNFCIYCQNYNCILDNISINSIGMCDSCIVINLSDEVLADEKKKILDRYQEEYKKWGSRFEE